MISSYPLPFSGTLQESWVRKPKISTSSAILWFCNVKPENEKRSVFKKSHLIKRRHYPKIQLDYCPWHSKPSTRITCITLTGLQSLTRLLVILTLTFKMDNRKWIHVKTTWSFPLSCISLWETHGKEILSDVQQWVSRESALKHTAGCGTLLSSG